MIFKKSLMFFFFKAKTVSTIKSHPMCIPVILAKIKREPTLTPDLTDRPFLKPIVIVRYVPLSLGQAQSG